MILKSGNRSVSSFNFQGDFECHILIAFTDIYQLGKKEKYLCYWFGRNELLSMNLTTKNLMNLFQRYIIKINVSHHWLAEVYILKMNCDSLLRNIHYCN